MGRLYAKTVSLSHISPSMKDEMFILFSEYYDNIKKEKFLSDLEHKEKVILLRDRDKILRGFSTIVEITTLVENKTVIGIFTGDTVIHNHFWGGIALTLEFFKNILLTKLKNPSKNVYWFLISKGYKTYLLLANNFKNYYPRHDRPTPAFDKMVIDSFGRKLYGDFYYPSQLLIRSHHQFDRLKKTVAPIDPLMLQANPKIEFFQNMNPQWEEGTELCCIGKVDLGLVQKYLTRTFKKCLSFKHRR